MTKHPLPKYPLPKRPLAKYLHTAEIVGQLGTPDNYNFALKAVFKQKILGRERELWHWMEGEDAYIDKWPLTDN